MDRMDRTKTIVSAEYDRIPGMAERVEAFGQPRSPEKLVTSCLSNNDVDALLGVILDDIDSRLDDVKKTIDRIAAAQTARA